MKARFLKGRLTAARIGTRQQWPTTGFETIRELIGWFVRPGDLRWSLRQVSCKGILFLRATVPGVSTQKPTLCHYWIDHEGDPNGPLLEAMELVELESLNHEPDRSASHR